MYVVAALGSLVEGWSQTNKQKEQNFVDQLLSDKCNSCGADHGPDCFFNTAVVYDPQGRLVAHYNK